MAVVEKLHVLLQSTQTSVSTSLNLTKLGRNLSAGNRVYSKVIRVAENDVIEFYLIVTAGNNKDLYNVNIKIFYLQY